MSEKMAVPTDQTGQSAEVAESAAVQDAVHGGTDGGSFSEAPLAPVAPVVLSVGQQLRAAREAKGKNVADVARALKLSPHQVVALEEGDWARLPGNTIIRGFVRNYARLLMIDAEPLMAALTAMQMPQSARLDFPTASNAALPESGRVDRRDYAAVFSGIALVALAVLAYFFLPPDFWQSTLNALTPAAKPPATASAPETPPAAPEQSPAPPVATPAPEVALPPQPAAQAVTAAASAPSSGLKLSFSQPSWVEIRDRSGQIIFSQLNPAGSQRDIEGQPPFALVIGNATNVTVQYKGKVIELSQRSKDDVARLNLD
ncbi:MAG: RodZ domain-containing protein [Rhodocyclaceae bacterium]